LRQGDLLPTLLFDIIVDMFVILPTRVKGGGQVDGLIPHLVDGRVHILQYSDDTIIFMEDNLEKALNMKLILCIFEQLSCAKEIEHQYRELFGCEIGVLIFKYLGIPIHLRRLRNSDWKTVEDRFVRKLGSWVGKLLSYGDRLILINYVLTSFIMFMLYFFKYLKGDGKDWISFVRGLFW
jgi:hypothetical protein